MKWKILFPRWFRNLCAALVSLLVNWLDGKNFDGEISLARQFRKEVVQHFSFCFVFRGIAQKVEIESLISFLWCYGVRLKLSVSLCLYFLYKIIICLWNTPHTRLVAKRCVLCRCVLLIAFSKVFMAMASCDWEFLINYFSYIDIGI